MGKAKENPRYNVISMRVTDDEKEQLDKMRGKQSYGGLIRDKLFGATEATA